MPDLPQPQLSTIDVAADFLPYPATKLVVTQYLESNQDPPFWAWIAVGAFLDREDRIIWSTELFVAILDAEFESDDDTEEEFDEGWSISDSSSEEEQEDAYTPTVEQWEAGQTASVHQVSPHAHQDYLSPGLELGSRYYLHPPSFWDPTHQAFLKTSRRTAIAFTWRIVAVSSAMSGGWNPMTGRDSTGTRPPLAPYGAPVASQGQAYIPHFGGPGCGYGAAPPYSPWTNSAYGFNPTGSYGAPAGGFYPYPAQGPAGGFHTQQTFSYQPNGAGNVLPRQPQPWPTIDPTMPAAQMTNSSGGVGCEPGYNYFFHAEHTKAHILQSNTPPWRLPATAQLAFKAIHIPCNTTFAELLKGFGCTNPISKKNKVVEMVSSGGGKWYKGLEVSGADKSMLGKTIGEVGWDGTRTGNNGQKPVVCLWFCKE
ncbi:hypothetical protein XA68_15891 [Ophiocordyceps unilateralis]|uniref:Uncharacterized protein n=1 Tax=Ophiocordyceps unilateralis TaxID=268505 RepID=A0A2A9PTV6_OPHUN|nr:hypothetical protein XA68_15891 [Ophiocordyceps unilateralis]